MTTATKAGSVTLKMGRRDLLDAVLVVDKAVPTRTARPVLQNVRIGDGLISGTDLELRIDRTIDEQCEPFLVPCDRLLSILRAAQGDEVTLTAKGSTVTVKCGRGRWELPTEDVSEFPDASGGNLTATCRLPVDQFVRAVKSTVYATDNESSRYALGGVLIDVTDGNPTFVATDGRRLASVQTETDQAVDDCKRIVPAKIVSIVASLAHGEGSVQIESDGKVVRFELDGVVVTGPLLEGSFPKWRDVVGDLEGSPAVIERADLLAAVAAARIVTSEQSKAIRLEWGEKLVVTARSSEYGESKVTAPLTTNGDAMPVKLDPEFVMEFLRGLPPDEEPAVEVYCPDPQSRVLLRCGDYTGVIMPMAEEA